MNQEDAKSILERLADDEKTHLNYLGNMIEDLVSRGNTRSK
jgi:rubrerythrin